MPGGNYNMEDPAVQEKIRRGPHEYIATAGKHGMYVAKPFRQQEYPKMMGKAPHPKRQDFERVNGVIVPADLAQANYQHAVVEWDRYMTSTLVNSKAEEQAWLKENGR